MLCEPGKALRRSLPPLQPNSSILFVDDPFPASPDQEYTLFYYVTLIANDHTIRVHRAKTMPTPPTEYSYYNQYDGGVIELQVDGSEDWVDIGDAVYDGWIYDGSNPLADRGGFTYLNWSYPAFDTVTVDLGTGYAGQTVRVRFRAGSDEAVGWGGWTLDRVAFGGIAGTPFSTLGLDAGRCAGKASSTGDSSCATAPGAVNPALVLLLGVALALRLRRRRAR